MKMAVAIQRLEGLVIFLGSLYIFNLRDGNWLAFILGFIAVDITMVGYLVNNKVGAYIYNLGHTFVMPSLVYVLARHFDNSTLTFISLIWFAHIAFDRALGWGLKYETGFRDTHLGKISKPKP